MKFQDYIQSLSNFNLKKITENKYILIENKKTLILTPDNMHSEEEIRDLLKKDDFDPNIKTSVLYNHESKTSSSLFSVGDDDLHPPIGKFSRKPKGSKFNPEDLVCDIKKSDIYPNKKSDPDNDNLEKKGGDDKNPFLY